MNNILFIDIETVPLHESWALLSEKEKQLYAKKTKYLRKDSEPPEAFYERAGIWAEFGKIICISVARFVWNKGQRQLKVISFYGDDEEKILQDFRRLLDNRHINSKYLLCAHNGKEFDFPFIARRMIIHQIQLPKKLDLFGKKPWEVPHLDTLELWKFGDYKHFTSLQLLTHILNIPSPKQDIDGSEVAMVYYQEQNLQRIVTYCENDTMLLRRLSSNFLMSLY
ncbi:3'-5' exonuclease [Tenacibaculum sp. SG-28]|uniref:3'-5' exonuclease n=1 Tax=Tenacibaculum sp. SG-28 TaxID=754426 RepID=UPI0026C71700